MHEIEETAKATQEVAKTTGKVIDASSAFGNFVSKYVGGSFEQAAGIIEDTLKYIRWERQRRLFERAETYANSSGLEMPDRSIPLKFALPLLHSATLEEDDDLQDLWAKLLVNFANKQSGVNVNRIYVDILDRISPFEAHILKVIYCLDFEQVYHAGISTINLPIKAMPMTSELRKENRQPADDVKLAIANLDSVGCLAKGRTIGGGETFAEVNPTHLGKCFFSACALDTAI